MEGRSGCYIGSCFGGTGHFKGLVGVGEHCPSEGATLLPNSSGFPLYSHHDIAMQVSGQQYLTFLLRLLSLSLSLGTNEFTYAKSSYGNRATTNHITHSNSSNSPPPSRRVTGTSFYNVADAK
jgi:hypothetical protein